MIIDVKSSLLLERNQILLDVYMALNSIRRMWDYDPVFETGLCGLFDMTIQMLGLAPHNNRHAEYARPNQFELILLAVETVPQPNAPDNIAVL